MISDLGLTEIQWGWVMAAFLVGYTIFQFPGGMLGDRFGPRRVIAAIAVLNTGGNLVGAINAPLVPWLALVFGWTFAIASGAVFALAGALLMFLVRADRPLDAGQGSARMRRM